MERDLKTRSASNPWIRSRLRPATRANRRWRAGKRTECRATAGTRWHAALCEALGLDLSEQKSFSMDVETKMRPTFEEKVLSHQNGHYIVRDWMGAVMEISDRFDYTYIRTAKDFVTRK